MKKLTIVKKEIERVISNSFSKTDPEHSKTTLEWLMKLKPDSSNELQISALAHDIERGLREKNNESGSEKIKNYDNLKKEHCKRSAEIICKLLVENNFEKSFIDKVYYYVLNHEIGGDENTNFLMDADSLSFFQSNLEHYFEKNNKETTYFKINYMYKRMSQKAKNLAKKFKYENIKLNKLFKDAISNLSSS